MSKVVFFRGISVLYWQEEEKLVVNHENSLRTPQILTQGGILSRVTGNNANREIQATNHRSRIDLSIAFIHQNREQTRITGTPLLRPSLTALGVTSDPFLGNNLLQLGLPRGFFIPCRRHQAKRLRRILGSKRIHEIGGYMITPQISIGLSYPPLAER